MSRNPTTYNLIVQLRERYIRALVGKESLIKIINEVELSEHVYNSNAIENSTLTLEETEKILMEIELSRYVSEREIYEAKNLARVMTYVEEKALQMELSLPLMLLLHKMLLGNIREEIAGRFRSATEWVRVGNYIAEDPANILACLQTALTELQINPQEHIVSRIARFHLTFEHIHPFVDGNGRIGRVLNNYVLLREGYVPINITFVNRSDYYQAFKEFDTTQSIHKMELIVARALANSYHKRLAYLEGKEIVKLSEYAKRTKVSPVSLLNKASRQTIPAFREKGVWKIGV
jgi:Fic family protein